MIERPQQFRPLGFGPLSFRPDSLAGYKLYSRSTRNGADSLAAYVGRSTTQFTLTGLANDSVRYVHVAAVTACGIEQPMGKLRRVAIDGGGTVEDPAPNAPTGLTADPGPGGVIDLSWDYDRDKQSTKPADFAIYSNGGSGAVDYTSPIATVSYTLSRHFTYQAGPYSHGTSVTFAVRARSSGGVDDGNTDEVTATADAQAPDQPSAFDTVIESR